MLPADLRCSFCAKSERDVASLIAGPSVFICDECVDVCIEILGAKPRWIDAQMENLERLRRQAEGDPPTARR